MTQNLPWYIRRGYFTKTILDSFPESEESQELPDKQSLLCRALVMFIAILFIPGYLLIPPIDQKI